ncbi:MAG TPA: D-alanyl-D-alanine carboxypeptidase family protein [Melioribacteraceae bacterium]|nr:D-alanyl-D-alanine carboxypeptidase family protein [Melioribacteraceae bacterium]
MALLIISVFTAFYFYLTFTQINLERLNFLHRVLLKRIVKKWVKYKDAIPKEKLAITEYDALICLLNFIEIYLVKQILTINPKEIGFNGSFYSLELPQNLVKVDSVNFTGIGEGRETGVQYCPKHSYNDFVAMSKKMFDEIGKSILIDSGYRSPGRQAFLFVYYLVTDNNFSLKENGKWIALPGYSEHGSPVNNAIDIATEEGVNGFSENQIAEDFEKTDEYKWLIKNADSFNFYLSYPKENKLGVAYEPWHWHWEKRKPEKEG